MNAVIREKIIEAIAEKAEISAADIDPDLTLEGLGLDSLHLMELALWADREFSLQIPEGDLRHDQKVREALAYFADRMGAAL